MPGEEHPAGTEKEKLAKAKMGLRYSERAMLRSGFVRSQQRTEHLKIPKKEIYVLKITKKGNKNKIFT